MKTPLFLILSFCLVIESHNAESNQLNIFKENPYYFEYKGNPIFLIGATHKDGWTPISIEDRDYKRDLDRLHEIIQEINSPNVCGLVRIIPYFPDFNWLQPWKKLENGKYKLDEFEVQWVSRLKAFLDYAKSKDIIVSLELWEDWSITRGPGGVYNPGDNAGWSVHPFRPENNVNYGTDFLPSKTNGQDAPFYRTIPGKDNNKVVLEFQKLYADKIVELTKHYGNILYNLSNESRASLLWSQFWSEYMHSKLGPGKLIGDMPSTNRKDGQGEMDPALNPMSLIKDSRYDFVDISQAMRQTEFGNDINTAIISSADRIYNYYQFMYENNCIKPLMVSKIYENTPPIGVPFIWSKFIAGAASARYHRPPDESIIKDVEDFQFNTIKYLGEFIKTTRFWELSPQHQLANAIPSEIKPLVLARPGMEYIIMLIGGNNAIVQLNMEPGKYRIIWYNPDKGIYIQHNEPELKITKSEIVDIIAPALDNGVIILHITKIP